MQYGSEFRLGPARKQLTKVSIVDVHSFGDDLPRLFHGMLFAVGGYAQERFEERLEIRDRHDRSPSLFMCSFPLKEKAGQKGINSFPTGHSRSSSKSKPLRLLNSYYLRSVVTGFFLNW